jgi:hypothetical protein
MVRLLVIVGVAGEFPMFEKQHGFSAPHRIQALAGGAA